MSEEQKEKPKGPLELKLITFREDSENTIVFECPYCKKRGQYSNPQDAKLWWHPCKADDREETVAFVNGYAMRGISTYNRLNVPKGRS